MDPEAVSKGYGRIALSIDSVTVVEAGRPVYLAVPAESEIRVSGFKMAVQRIGGRYTLGDAEYTLHLLSVGVRPSEKAVEIESDGRYVGNILTNGYVPRPAFTAQSANTSTPEERAELLDIFLLSIIDLIQMTVDPQYEKYQIAWDRLERAWTDQESESTIPPMSLIVRHAQKHGALVRDLYEKPRHLLRRERKLTSVDRVQQLDIACVRWLSRQPGRNVYERAGPKQRILAVQRFESLDTLENRVFADFSLRTSREATNYTKRYERLKLSTRWAQVFRYGRRCHHVQKDMAENGVSVLHQPVVPNFVLLQDIRYRRLWQAYRELKRKMDEEDECWRWQHRLWLDYARLITHLSLRREENFEPLAETPLRINEEQERGLWVGMGAQSGTWLFNDQESEIYVVSFIWSTESDHPKTGKWAYGLGCPAHLHIQRLSDSREGFIAFWGYHSFAENSADLSTIATSADNAISGTKQYHLITEDQHLMLRGLVLVSEFRQIGGVSLEKVKKVNATSALRVGASFEERQRAMRRIATSVKAHIQSMFQDQ